MAQSYLGLDKNVEMEIVGENYFNHLATHSFFQDFEKDDDGNVICCKLHDIVHDFAQFLSNKECYSMEVHGTEAPFINPSLEKVLHLKLTLDDEATFSESICNIKRLRSLLISCSVNNKNNFLESDALPVLSGKLKRLRSLKLKSLDEPKGFLKEIGKLVHLRYLQLSIRFLEKLPETLCELYNLETLDIRSCHGLRELPEKIGKLINLRHLINDIGPFVLSCMPIGIKRLTSLRTLSVFVLSEVGSNGDDSKAANLDCLENLKHLQGHLEIRVLGNVSNVKGMKVVMNNSLSSLELNFFHRSHSPSTDEDDELFLEALTPPSYLEILCIAGYGGNTISSDWMATVNNLRKLTIRVCLNLKQLPPLGKLPFLESLDIENLGYVESVGSEFWGIESDGISPSLTLFPKLKYLKFFNMREWEEWKEWDYEIIRKGEEDYDIKILPSLASLEITWCPKLKALPGSVLKTLNELHIDNCYILKERYKEETGEAWPEIFHIPNIRIDQKYKW